MNRDTCSYTRVTCACGHKRHSFLIHPDFLEPIIGSHFGPLYISLRMKMSAHVATLSRGKACLLACHEVHEGGREGISSFSVGHKPTNHIVARVCNVPRLLSPTLLGSEGEGRRHYFEPPFWQADSAAAAASSAAESPAVAVASSVRPRKWLGIKLNWQHNSFNATAKEGGRNGRRRSRARVRVRGKWRGGSPGLLAAHSTSSTTWCCSRQEGTF